VAAICKQTITWQYARYALFELRRLLGTTANMSGRKAGIVARKEYKART